MSSGPQHPSENKSDSENTDAEKAENKGVKTKAQVRTLIFMKAFGIQVLALVGIVSLIGHKYLFLGCAFSLIYFAVVAAVTYRQLIHFQATHKEAKKRAVIILFCGIVPTILIGCIFGIPTPPPPPMPGREPIKRLAWEPPELPQGCQFVSIIIGGDECTQRLKGDGQEVGLMMTAYQDTNGAYHRISIISDHVFANRLYIDVAIAGTHPFGAFKLSGTRVEGHLPPLWDMNFHATAVEIVNNDNVPIYQIVYKRPEVVGVYGFIVGSNSVFAISHSGIQTIPPFIHGFDQGLDPKILGLKRIFDYPALAYPGKRVE